MVAGVAAGAACLWWAAVQSPYGAGSAADPLILVSRPPSGVGGTSTVFAGATAPANRNAETSAAAAPFGSAELTGSTSVLSTTVLSIQAPSIAVPSSAGPTATGEPVGESTSWADILAGLDAARAAAFAAGDTAGLTRVYAAGSASMERDAAALAELNARGLRAVGLTLQIEQVDLVSASVDGTLLRVVDRLPPYQLVDSTGAAVESPPGRESTTWLLTLTPGPDGWLISEIVRE